MSESKNLAADHPEVVAELKQLLKECRADLGDGNNRGIFLVPADGSAPARMVVEGGFGVMGWLPAAS